MENYKNTFKNKAVLMCDIFQSLVLGEQDNLKSDLCIAWPQFS